MAKPRSRNYPKLRAKATSLDTPPDLLIALRWHRSIKVQRWALANPSLPTKQLREALLSGEPAAWDNPAAMFEAITLPVEDAAEGAFRCACELARLLNRQRLLGPEDAPYPVSLDMRALLDPYLRAAWGSEDAVALLKRVATYGQACGNLSRQHHASTLLGCLVVRSWRTCFYTGHPDGTDPEVDKAESWAWSGETDQYKAGRLISGADRQRRLLHHAAVCTPDWPDRYGMKFDADGSRARAALIRAAVPHAPWLEVLDG